MTFNEYDKSVLKTWNTSIPGWDRVMNAALGLGEAGEVQNEVKKWRFHGKGDRKAQILDELGDVLYYCSAMAREMDSSLEVVAEMNRVKLAARYPEGFKGGRQA